MTVGSSLNRGRRSPFRDRDDPSTAFHGNRRRAVNTAVVGYNDFAENASGLQVLLAWEPGGRRSNSSLPDQYFKFQRLRGELPV